MRRQHGVVESPTFLAISATAKRGVLLQQAQDFTVEAVHRNLQYLE
jgi:hypothetical protein